MTARKTKAIPSQYRRPPIRLDIGCGPNKKDGHSGSTASPLAGVDHVVNAGREPWPFEDGSVRRCATSHFLEHLTASGALCTSQ